MQVTIIAITGPGPGGMQRVLELELPAVPLPGEHIDYNGRKYRTLERSWRFMPLDQPEGALGVAVGLLVEQIGGPPHVITNSGGQAAN